MKDIVREILDYLKEENIPATETPKEMRKILDEVYAEVFTHTEGVFVIKKDYRVEDFQEDKIYNSIANASDSCGAPLNKSDIKNILTVVKHKIQEDQSDFLYTKDLRDLVTQALEKFGFHKVKDCYMKN